MGGKERCLRTPPCSQTGSFEIKRLIARESSTDIAMDWERSDSQDCEAQHPGGFLDDAKAVSTFPENALAAVACGLALSLALAGSAVSQQSANSVDHRPGAAQPDQRLRRGVNFSHWFAQSQHGYGEPHLSLFIVNHDIELVRKAGFTHVRLPVSMEQSFRSGAAADPYVATLVKKIADIHRAGLAVVVDLHPSQDEKQALIDSGNGSYFVEGWRSLARALAHLKHELVVLELMNEPTPMVGAQWRALQERTIEAIRTVAPRNTLIANPGGWSGIEDYAEFRPYPDANVVYTAHVYEPLLFTHQGTTWAWDVAGQVKDVWWPLSPRFGEAASNA